MTSCVSDAASTHRAPVSDQRAAAPAWTQIPVVPLLLWEAEVVWGVQAPGWAEEASEQMEVQVTLAALEDLQGRRVQLAHMALQVLLVLRALVGLVVLVTLVAPYPQEALESQDHLYHQCFQVDLQILLILWILEDPWPQVHLADQLHLVVQQHLSLL